MGITKEAVAKIKDMWNLGLSTQEIAAKFKLPEGLVKTIVNRK